MRDILSAILLALTALGGMVAVVRRQRLLLARSLEVQVRARKWHRCGPGDWSR
jgi:hypothetical protein